MLCATTLTSDLDRHEWMWIDELKLLDDPLYGHLLSVVVHARDRMMSMGCHDWMAIAMASARIHRFIRPFYLNSLGEDWNREVTSVISDNQNSRPH